MIGCFRKCYVVLMLFFWGSNALAQDFQYKIQLDSIQIPELGGIQSYAFGQWDGKWLIIGGRLDGLHRRQPWASFDSVGNNREIIVVDPIVRKKWTADLNHFHTDLNEQLSSTNMQFKQVDSLLVLIGGYGYSPSRGDHITFPYFAVVNIPKTIHAIVNGEKEFYSIAQVPCEQCAVTGGKLMTIDSTFYLIGGHRFDGRYNPIGGGTFEQTYTNAIRKFNLKRIENSAQVVWLESNTNEKLFHRRDLNVLPQLDKHGKEFLTVFSGVFQEDYDIPFTNSFSVEKDTVYTKNDFAQYYNHYHCAAVSLYDSEKSKNFNLFFGGIAQYYDSSEVLIQNSDVPFVQHISLVESDANGNMKEYLLETKMPGYMGAGSEFILNPALMCFPNGSVDLNKHVQDTLLLGYIYGGIHSAAASIFWINDGTQSKASEYVFPVYLVKDNSVVNKVNIQSFNGYQLQVFPDVSYKEFYVSYNLHQKENITIEIKNKEGQLMLSKTLKNRKIGIHSHTFKFKKLDFGQTYFLSFKANGGVFEQKIRVE
jgi:hypothetical protein